MIIAAGGQNKESGVWNIENICHKRQETVQEIKWRERQNLPSPLSRNSLHFSPSTRGIFPWAIWRWLEMILSTFPGRARGRAARHFPRAESRPSLRCTDKVRGRRTLQLEESTTSCDRCLMSKENLDSISKRGAFDLMDYPGPGHFIQRQPRVNLVKGNGRPIHPKPIES